MFFVADINGELHPYVGVRPIANPAAGITDTNVISFVAAATPMESAAAVAPTAAAAAAQSAEADIAAQSQPQDAAVFEGHAVEPDAALQAGLSSGVSIAASAMVYRSISNLDPAIDSADTKPPMEEVLPAGEAAAVGLSTGRPDPGAARHRVLPIGEEERKAPARQDATIIAQQIMSAPVVSLPEDATVADAIKIFRESGFRNIPVVSRNGRLVGALADRDFLPQLNWDMPEVFSHPDEEHQLVRSMMRLKVITARPEAEIRRIAQVMHEVGVGSMPIVDEFGLLQGMLTQGDILHAFVEGVGPR